ncbi:DUF664 domain-containing protein [Streptomyces sp. NPDC048664]|uniref:mycothiol transferase n=1 Tax=Streptomyces sp. NPDC048664 TaxID=3154505 RepID=UPI003447031B
MLAKDILIDAYGRIQEEVHSAVQGLDPDALCHRPGGSGNSIAWLVWHLTRVQDDHVADAGGFEQLWLSQDWAERFGLDLPRADTGYGHTSGQVARVRVESGSLLTGYHDAVHERTVDFLRGLTAKDFERVVDERWDPPVTLGVRLVSVLSDDLQHVGQAAYLRGLLQSAAS